jgi:hypothetical protein
MEWCEPVLIDLTKVDNKEAFGHCGAPGSGDAGECEIPGNSAGFCFLPGNGE